MNKKLFAIIFSVFLLIPSFSYAICEGRINPCPPDTDGDGRYGEYEPSDDSFAIGYDDIDDDKHQDNEMCEFCHIFELVNNILVYVLTCLAPIISGVMLILGGFYLMIAGVDPGKMQKGKEIITAAIVGLMVIFVSWVILNTFLSSMGIAEWTGLNPESGDNSWWQIKCN